MSGRLFAVVGPSGSGKDTLIAAIAQARPDLHIVRRVITRPSAAGGEPFEGVTPAEFERRRAAGAFLFDWQAHGLSYGIPADLARVLATGRDALFNGSRAMLAEAAAKVPALHILHVTARPEVLAARLAARGRETPRTSPAAWRARPRRCRRGARHRDRQFRRAGRCPAPRALRPGRRRSRRVMTMLAQPSHPVTPLWQCRSGNRGHP
ncbi:hypothetical protein ACFSZS_08105 [Seohaeicola zhoushanensis]